MALKILFTATATCTGGRNGHSETDDHSVAVDLSIPKAMGGPGKPNTATPEHLFATGYAACFGSAVDYIAHQTKKDASGAAVTCAVSIGTRDEGGFGLAVKMTVALPNLSQAEAEVLVAEAHKICPYSNATRGNITVDLAAQGR